MAPKDEIVEEAVKTLEIEIVDDPAPEGEEPEVVDEIVEDEPIIEDEPVVIEDPAVDYQALYEKQRQTNDDLQQEIYNGRRPEQPEVVDTTEVAIPNQYDEPEAFARYLSDRDAKTTENAVKAIMDSPDMQNLRMTVGMREHETQKKETKEELGEFFDYERDQQAISDLQRQHPTMSMTMAAKVLSYGELSKSNSQLKEGRVERKKAQVPSTAGASRLVETRVESETEKATLTKSQALVAQKYFGHHPDVVSGKITALEKYQRGAQHMTDGGFLE